MRLDSSRAQMAYILLVQLYYVDVLILVTYKRGRRNSIDLTLFRGMKWLERVEPSVAAVTGPRRADPQTAEEII